jgi:hypothetical protein
MKVEPIDAGRLARGCPFEPELRPLDRQTLGAVEDERIRLGADEVDEVFLEQGEELLRGSDSMAPGVRLGWTEHHAAASQFDGLLFNNHRPVEDVDAATAEAGKLAEAERTVRRQEHRQQVPTFDGAGDGGHLLRLRDRPLLCRVAVGTLDLSWVRPLTGVGGAWRRSCSP